MNKLKNIRYNIKDSFEGIVYPKKERVKKEFILIAVSTIVVALTSAGVNMLAQHLLNLIF